jgi:hypothetical protein
MAALSTSALQMGKQLLFSKDYICEDSHFSVSASCVTISNPADLIFSSETGNYPGIKSRIEQLSEEAQCQIRIDGM